MFRFLPEQASAHAPEMDWLHHLITDISVFFIVAICGAMIYFAIRYRKRDSGHHETPQIKGSHLLEIIWTVVPTLICIYIAYYGVAIYRDMVNPGEKPNMVNVTARQWKWDFQYENGKTTTNEAVIPVGEPVKFILTSTDVLHSFFVPTMRVKKDAIPNRYTYVSFTPVKTGTYPIFCTEYCGKDHSYMLASLKVVSRGEYDQWLADRSEELAALKMPPAELGRKIWEGKGACKSCHSLDGSRLVGPSWLKLFGRTEKDTQGNEFVVDENYIKESIIEPNKHVVAGYAPNLMPSYAGQLDDREINGVIAFIRTLDGTGASAPAAEAAAPAAPAIDLAKATPVERGKHLYETKLCITCHSIDGSKIVGPSFKGIYGAQHKFADGSTAVVDDAYIKQSILQPTAKVVEGYAPVMPPFQGQLDDAQIADITAFIKSLK